MKKFEIGKVYGDHAVKFEIVARTAKTITFVKIAHAGKANERRYDQKKIKIREWEGKEVFYAFEEIVEAA